jgi:hypothetical protein
VAVSAPKTGRFTCSQREPVDNPIRSHRVIVHSTLQLDTSTPFHRRADEQLIQTALDRRPLMRGRHLGGGHDAAGEPHLQPGTRPIRRREELTLNRRTQRRPQIRHQLVGVESQRRLLISVAGEDRFGRTV